MTQTNTTYRKLPGVDTLLTNPACVSLAQRHGTALVTFAVRQTLGDAREAIGKGKKAPDEKMLIAGIVSRVSEIAEPSLKPVINATGVVLHTNLSRAPLGEHVMADIAAATTGYCNVEFDLNRARRGQRGSHITPLLRFLTGAEDAVVVNNNAAALVLVLSTLAAHKEVIISRGELIEIGGAFRIPDIMRASGARMVEVGTTNRTRIDDYQNALSPKTALIFKAHQSNYTIHGFAEDVSVKDLAEFAHSRNLPMVYDIGSGLLRKPAGLALGDEPDVATCIAHGADIVTFSCDKLLGGPQAGVAAGNSTLIKKLAKAPLMRALRVGKLTLAALSSACRHYLSDTELCMKNPTFKMLQQSPDEMRKRAERLVEMLEERGIECRAIGSAAQVGGGSLPDLKLPSIAIQLVAAQGPSKQKERFAQNLYHALLLAPSPILGILREGHFLLDIFTVSEIDLTIIAENIAAAIAGEPLR